MTKTLRLNSRDADGRIAVLLVLAMMGLGASAARADSMSSTPPDANSYSRPLTAEDLNPPTANGNSASIQTPQFDVFIVDTVVNNTDSNLKNTDTFGDEEISIAINPRYQNEITITAFREDGTALLRFGSPMIGGTRGQKTFRLLHPQASVACRVVHVTKQSISLGSKTLPARSSRLARITFTAR